MKNTAGARAMMLQWAWLFFMASASSRGNTAMIRKLMVPRMQKATVARWNTLFTWLVRPRALASDTILDRATGSPPVEMTMSRE